MEKYDAFGRPIYETAEEYNRAKKTGSNSRTYDSPEGDAYKHNSTKKQYRYQRAADKYTNQMGLKKSKTSISGMVMFFTVIVVVFVVSMFNIVRDSYDNDYEIYEEEMIGFEDVNTDGYGEYLGDDTSPLPDGFATFSYNGQICTLPMTFEEVDKMGFSLEAEYDIDYLLPMEYEELLVLNGEDGFMSAMIRINNYTDAEIPLGKGLVDYFYIENPSAYDETENIPDFVFGDGFTFKSSYENIESYFGIPYYHYEEEYEDGGRFDSYEWAYYGEEEIHFVSITFWNGAIVNVGIEKRVIEEKY